jgi:hypothetical protein
MHLLINSSLLRMRIINNAVEEKPSFGVMYWYPALTLGDSNSIIT